MDVVIPNSRPISKNFFASNRKTHDTSFSLMLEYYRKFSIGAQVIRLKYNYGKVLNITTLGTFYCNINLNRYSKKSMYKKRMPQNLKNI